MEITIDLKKSLEENASQYFDRAKKLRKKAEGARLAVEKAKARLASLEEREKKRKAAEERKEEERKKKSAKKKWYHNFRWFVSSDGFLVIGGRDATTNEIVVKKHAEKGDLIFHTEMPASPFVIIKAEGKRIPETTIDETARFTASYSSAWKRGLGSVEVFHVDPDQVTKEARSGEYVAKGAFMIYGKKTRFTVEMDLALGERDGEIMAGPVAAVRKNCGKYIEIAQGGDKNSDVAKKVQRKIGGELNEIIKVLPQGCRIR